jgi:hypothetical protein
MNATTPIIRKSGDWLTARAGDEVMMMSASEGLYLGLNTMGARIWDLLDTVGDHGQLRARLMEEFAVSEDQCRAEVEGFLADLLRYKAIEFVAPDAD